jgi:hypothetical protein
VTVLDWWNMLGLDKDMTVEETRKLGSWTRTVFTSMLVPADVLPFLCVTGTCGNTSRRRGRRAREED